VDHRAGHGPFDAVVTGAPIVVSLALDLVRGLEWANRLGFGIKIRQDPDGWSWPLGPPGETTAELVAGASLALSLRWLVRRWSSRGGQLSAVGVAGRARRRLRHRRGGLRAGPERRRSSVRVTDQRVLIERCATGPPSSGPPRAPAAAAGDAKVEVIADVRGRGGIHLLVLPRDGPRRRGCEPLPLRSVRGCSSRSWMT